MNMAEETNRTNITNMAIRPLAIGLGMTLLCLVTGCQTVSTSHIQDIGSPNYSPSDPAQVQLLRTEPTRSHVRLGEVRANPSTQNVDVTHIEGALRQEAAKLGADAVVIVYDRTRIMGAFVTGPWWGRSVQTVQGRVVIGVAIKYL